MRLAIDEICSSEDMENFQSSSKENLLRLTEQVMRMDKLVKDLLNLSSLGILININLKRIYLTEILTSLIEDYQFLAKVRNIHMEINIPSQIVIFGDEEKPPQDR